MSTSLKSEIQVELLGWSKQVLTGHVCDLVENQEEITIPRPPPFAPFCDKLLYKLRKFTTLTRRHPDTKRFFRSISATKREKRRHVLNPRYKYIVHPFSNFCLIQESIETVMLIATFIIEPMNRAFDINYMSKYGLKQNLESPILYFLLIQTFIYTTDIIIIFFKGYSIDESKEIVLEPVLIIKRYLKTFFIFDFVANVQYFIYFFARYQPYYRTFACTHLYVLRYFRIYTMSSYFYRLMLYCKVKESIIHCLLGVLFSFFLLHWLTCLLFAIPLTQFYLTNPDINQTNSWVVKITLEHLRNDATWGENIYFKCFVVIICHFFGAGKGNIMTHDRREQFYLACVTTIGMITQMYALAHVLFYFGTIRISESKYEELIGQLNDYVITKKLPTELRKRLFLYYETRYQKRFFLEDAILNSLSEHLRCEVLLYSGKTLLESVRVFQGASKSVVGTILGMMKSDVFLKNDYLIRPNSHNEEFIYFISFGTCAVFLPDGREIYHLEDGHHFGEIQIVLKYANNMPMISVQAIETTELYYLNKEDFIYILKTFPEIVLKLQNAATSKLNFIYSKMEGESEAVDATDITIALRKGMILERGFRR